MLNCVAQAYLNKLTQVTLTVLLQQHGAQQGLQILAKMLDIQTPWAELHTTVARLLAVSELASLKLPRVCLHYTAVTAVATV